MAALPYIQLYVADYLADTMHLTTEEHGAYMLLIMNYWQRGKPLDNSNGRLAFVARMTNERWNFVEPTLREFFNVVGDSWQHERIDQDLERVKNQQDQRSQAGQKSAEARASRRKNTVKQGTFNGRSTVVGISLNENSTNTDTDTDTDTDTEKKNKKPPAGLSDSLFCEFWEVFPSGRKTDRAKALKAFKAAIKKADARTIIDSAAEYAKSEVGQGQYVKGPTPWLNGACWEDSREAWNHRSEQGTASKTGRGSTPMERTIQNGEDVLGMLK